MWQTGIDSNIERPWQPHIHGTQSYRSVLLS
jgi:hypothetical protein